MSTQDQEDLQGRVGPFVTYVERVRPNGVVARWGSRRYRKHLQGISTAGSTWWAPRARGWWIAVLFAIGSLLFALGAVPGYASAVGASWDAVTFFTGSLFFTAAGFLSYRETVDAGPQPPGTARRRFFVYQPDRIDWWATAVQLAGTVFFNVSTGVAMVSDLSAPAAHRHVWRPDAFGSVCFLVASALACYISASTGKIHNAELTNLGTFIGALCFLAGAILLMPERTEDAEAPVTTPDAPDQPTASTSAEYPAGS